MVEEPFLPEEEYRTRLAKAREKMAESGYDALLVSKPENIYYLTGLDHQGFFAYHVLVVPLKGPLCLIARAMERRTIEDQVPKAYFIGYPDSADPARVTCEALIDFGLASGRLGIEKASLCFPPQTYEAVVHGMPDVEWTDASGLVDDLRLVKSPREIEFVRRAAAVSDAMMRAALETAAPGVNEMHVAAEVHRAMILAGGENPGFSPFIRPTPRLHQEHTTWRDRELREGEGLFLEMAGCVRRYHAPMGRFVYLGKAPAKTRAIMQLCQEAFQATVETIRPGAVAAEVYEAWQNVVDHAGLSHYRRHHCGYLVGLGFPPTWTGGSSVVGLRHDSELVLQPGMAFHLLSWLMGTGRGDYFMSNTAVLTEGGCEVLTRTPARLSLAPAARTSVSSAPARLPDRRKSAR